MSTTLALPRLATMNFSSHLALRFSPNTLISHITSIQNAPAVFSVLPRFHSTSHQSKQISCDLNLKLRKSNHSKFFATAATANHNSNNNNSAPPTATAEPVFPSSSSSSSSSSSTPSSSTSSSSPPPPPAIPFVPIQNADGSWVSTPGSIRQVLAVGDKVYWCRCGLSKNQPYCDGSHKADKKFEPMEVVITEAKPRYSFCGCRLTHTPPFCDGTHKILKKKAQAAAGTEVGSTSGAKTTSTGASS